MDISIADIKGALCDELGASDISPATAEGLSNFRRVANRLVRESVEGPNAPEAARLIVDILKG